MGNFILCYAENRHVNLEDCNKDGYFALFVQVTVMFLASQHGLCDAGNLFEAVAVSPCIVTDSS